MPLQSAMVGVPVTGDRWRVSKSDSRRVSRGGGSEELGGPAAPKSNRGWDCRERGSMGDGKWRSGGVVV